MSRSRRTDRSAEWRRGVAAVEFALVAPFILLVMLAGADLSLFMRTMQRMDQTSTELALTVTQYQNLYDSDFTDLFNAAQTLAGSTPVTGLLGATIITGIVNNGGRQTISWQKRSPSATFNSLFGTAAGATPVMPDNYVLPSGGTLVAVEVFTSVSVWVFSLRLMRLMGGADGTGVTSTRSYALHQPRLGSLSTVNAGNRP
jgi:Flp pilus assembly protein TadG